MLLGFSPLVLAVACVAVAIVGLSKGGFAGIGMVSTPMLALCIGPLEAASFMLPIMIVQDVIAVGFYRRTFDVRGLRELLPGGALGVVLAYVFATQVSEAVVQFVLGLLSLAFAIREIWRHFAVRKASSDMPGRTVALGWAAGVAAGFTSAVAHAGSPPFQLYAVVRKLDKQLYVGTSVMFFAAINLMKVPSFAALGQVTTSSLLVSGAFVPIAVASSWAGVIIVRRIDPRGFSLAVSVILLGVSILLLLQGAYGMRAG